MTDSHHNSPSINFRRCPNAVFTELDGQTALFQSETCDYLVLNKTGSAIWELLDTKKSIKELCKQLIDEYEIDLETCNRETTEWMETAVEKKVVLRVTS